MNNKQSLEYVNGVLLKDFSPAKHKRGSVFDKNPLKCMNEYGVNYIIC